MPVEEILFYYIIIYLIGIEAENIVDYYPSSQTGITN